jgi:MraZ protein
VDDTAKADKVLPPRGSYPARVDDKGRLKLPVAFQEYLRAQGSKVFITSVDTITARVYPLPVWEANEDLFLEAGEDSELFDDLKLVADHYGSDGELDGQGRVLIHPELRRKLAIEDQPVWVRCEKGRITVYSQAVYEERQRKAEENVADKLKAAEKRGMR